VFASQTFTPKADKSGEKFAGSLAAKFPVPGADAEVTLKTSGVVAAQVEAANLFTKGLTLTVDCETPAPGKAGLLSSGKGTVDYKSDALTCKASYDYYKGDLHGAPEPLRSGRSPACAHRLFLPAQPPRALRSRRSPLAPAPTTPSPSRRSPSTPPPASSSLPSSPCPPSATRPSERPTA